MTKGSGGSAYPRTIKKRIKQEAVVVTRYGLVGIAATGVHMLIVSAMVLLTPMHTLLSNTIAFCAAFAVTFAGNYLWTFQSPGNPWRAIRRLLLISIAAFTVNTAVLSAIISKRLLPDAGAAFISAAVVPLTSFIIVRIWGFQNASTGNIQKK
jgi:putative flippase GtrA